MTHTEELQAGWSRQEQPLACRVGLVEASGSTQLLARPTTCVCHVHVRVSLLVNVPCAGL